MNRPDWMEHAHCASIGAETWDGLAPYQQRYTCWTACPVRGECLAWAVGIGVTHVVAGGHEFPPRPYKAGSIPAAALAVVK